MIYNLKDFFFFGPGFTYSINKRINILVADLKKIIGISVQNNVIIIYRTTQTNKNKTHSLSEIFILSPSRFIHLPPYFIWSDDQASPVS